MPRFLVVVLPLLACLLGGCTAREEAEKRCREECPQYGATFVRLSGCREDSLAIEKCQCWCRRGAEQGGGSEPLRIW